MKVTNTHEEISWKIIESSSLASPDYFLPELLGLFRPFFLAVAAGEGARKAEAVHPVQPFAGLVCGAGEEPVGSVCII